MTKSNLIENLKKMFKGLLCASMLITGFMMSPTKVEASPRASTITYSYIKPTISNTDISGTTTVKLKVQVINDSVTTSMVYAGSGSSCSSSNANATCTISNDYYSGRSYSDAAGKLFIYYTITLKTSTTTEERSYRATVEYNKLVSNIKR